VHRAEFGIPILREGHEHLNLAPIYRLQGCRREVRQRLDGNAAIDVAELRPR
jgi:hypothetical protein